MSVQTQIDRIKANIASAYAKAQEKGAELPTVQNSENLPAVIEAISAGGLPDNLRTITVTADPPERGTVEGGGMASDGMDVTVRAKPINGVAFAGWKKNETTISDNEDYTFKVAEDADLKAKFILIPQLTWDVKQLAPAFVSGNSTYSPQIIAFGNGIFVGFIQGGTNTYGLVFTSTDGLEWEQHTWDAPAGSYFVRNVYFFNGYFYALTSLSAVNGSIIRSADGINWDAATIPAAVACYNMAYGNGVYVVRSYISSNTTEYLYSYDGLNFIKGSFPYRCNCVVYGNGYFVALPNSTSQKSFCTSADGINWVTHTLAGIAPTKVFFVNKYFVWMRTSTLYYCLPGDFDNIKTVTLVSGLDSAEIIYVLGKYILLGPSNQVKYFYVGDSLDTLAKVDMTTIVNQYASNVYLYLRDGTHLLVYGNGRIIGLWATLAGGLSSGKWYILYSNLLE